MKRAPLVATGHGDLEASQLARRRFSRHPFHLLLIIASSGRRASGVRARRRGGSEASGVATHHEAGGCVPAARGDALFRLGRKAEARAEFERAACITRSEREREFLLGRAADCARC